jgi:hypothetical protein
MEVTNYVATGGTSSLRPPVAPSANLADGFTPSQKMGLAIILIVTSPAWTAVLGKFLGLPPALPAICAVLMPFLIPAVVMYFRNQAKRLAAMYPPPPLPQSFAPPQPQAWLQAPPLPVSAVPPSDTPRTTPNTNPLAHQPSSVIEDETKRLPS